jgi:hypothetical protein
MLNYDLAQVAADVVADEVLGMRGLDLDLRVGFGAFPAGENGPGEHGPACPYDSGTGYHVCPEFTLGNGIKLNRSYSFRDANGAAQETYDALTTASIHILKSAEGDVERNSENGNRWTASIDRNVDKTVSGLAGEETQRTWNGTANSAVDRAHFTPGSQSPDRTYDVTANGTAVNVVVPHPRHGDGIDPWPLSGTITKVVTGTVTVTKDGETETHEINRTVVITFNGTQFPTATVNGEPFELDLGKRWARRMDRKP